LRRRGHSLAQLRQASADGRLAHGFLEELFSDPPGTYNLAEAAHETGLEPALIERMWLSAGFSRDELSALTTSDVMALKRMAAVLERGFPLVAFLQLTRIYGQALSHIADAEARLFHMYVHQPLMDEEVPVREMAEEMSELAGELLPLTSPLMDHMHQRFLKHWVEQDVVGHMETEERGELGRLMVAIAFADLAGYTSFTEEAGDEQALSYLEHFIAAVSDTLPEDARVVKTVGDEVMVVGSDTGALTDWAVGFQSLFRDRPAARIGIHRGATLYRDGDYFGSDVNLAARVVSRAKGGEVLVTDAVADAVSGNGHLSLEVLGDVDLKGFASKTTLCRAYRRE
jgi:adenylate cyclase